MRAHSLIAPVKPYSDVALDLSGLVLGEVALDELPTQVDELVHHVAQLMEQVHLVFLLEQRNTESGRGRTLGRLKLVEGAKEDAWSSSDTPPLRSPLTSSQ